jgi:valyl-tRNA synthetase
MIDKTYLPSEVESRIYAAWESAHAFRAGRPERKSAAPYSIVIPPPNVTGSLHMGHALNNTLQDILARFERMRGKDVLWQPGTDHAGIATQAVVERQLMERQQPGSRELGREAFIQKVWEWKAESGGTIIGQLKRLGASCDWSRERFTMDEGLSRAVVKVFVELYRAGPSPAVPAIAARPPFASRCRHGRCPAATARRARACARSGTARPAAYC